jgi:hypothetical protein
VLVVIPLILTPIDDHARLSNNEIVPGVHTNLSVGTVRIVANVIMHAATLKMSVEAGL